MIEINNKEWNRLTKEDIAAFLTNIETDNDENFFYEFKRDEVAKDKFANEVSAFANTFGGYIFLGVGDDKKILGCTQWNEERIVSVLHDRVTPTPDFAVRRFEFGPGSIYIVKIEEGSRPPYITNTGHIFERVSSESVKITQSEKLNQLYIKRKDSLSKTREKIELPPIEKELFPNSLCGYIDMGFDLKLSSISSFQEYFYKFNFDEVCDYLKTTNNKYSISRIGWTYLIRIGEPERADQKPVSPPPGWSNYLEILADGSVRTRILLFADGNNNDVVVDDTIIMWLGHYYEDIYKIIFGEELTKTFIYARKYEKLTVLKQFKARYVERGDALDKYNKEHIRKYGSNFIVNGSRIPCADYLTIDQQYFNRLEIPYDTKHLYSLLFQNDFFNLGFIDMIEIPTKDGDE